jgi:hypothetical protein
MIKGGLERALESKYAKLFDHDVMFSIKWLHKYHVNNHIAGDYVIMRTIFAF